MKFHFYDEVRDAVTGFQGVVMSVSEEIVGTIRYGVFPPVKPDGTLPESYSFDEGQLDLVKEGPEGRRKETDQSPPAFQFGDVVRDTVTEMSGKIVTRVAFATGCVKYVIQGKIEEKGKIPEAHYQFQQLLELVQSKTPETQTVEQKRQTGGPPTIALRS